MDPFEAAREIALLSVSRRRVRDARASLAKSLLEQNKLGVQVRAGGALARVMVGRYSARPRRGERVRRLAEQLRERLAEITEAAGDPEKLQAVAGAITRVIDKRTPPGEQQAPHVYVQVLKDNQAVSA